MIPSTRNSEENYINLNKKELNTLESKHNSFDNIINIETIINYISSKLLSIIQKNKKMKRKPTKGENEPLYSKIIPVLSLKKYLIRIIKYTEAENNTLIVAYLYIIQLINKENYVLSINNIYRLLLGSVVLAKKVLEDLKYNNSYFCEIGGLTLEELNNIEFSLFIRMNFEVNPKKEEVNKIYKKIFDSLPQNKVEQIYNKN